MKVGDLVISKAHKDKANFLYNTYGIVLEWYDSPKGMVTVAWWRDGALYETNPCHISKLEVISECR